MFAIFYIYRLYCISRFIAFIAFLSLQTLTNKIIILITSSYICAIDLRRQNSRSIYITNPPSMEITNILLADSRLRTRWFLCAANLYGKKECNKIATP